MPQYIFFFSTFSSSSSSFRPNLEKQALNLIYFSLFTVLAIVVVVIVICARHEMLLINFVLFHFRAASIVEYLTGGISNREESAIFGYLAYIFMQFTFLMLPAIFNCHQLVPSCLIPLLKIIETFPNRYASNFNLYSAICH